MHHEHLRDCIDACTRCHHLCAETLDYCLEKGHNKPAHIRLLQDCIEICQTSADFMLRGSDLHALTCRVCADVCQRCADDCRQYGDDQMN
ncbi:MAG: four-helix bundle copper-binding protein, partial [Armatimonadetes bacterium]|nr:four-helix bundle copper-binding protein [Armatimonadota bacterium]